MTDEELKRAMRRLDRLLVAVVLLTIMGLVLRYGHCEQFGANRESCPATRCSVSFQGVERQSSPAYVALWCNAATPCQVSLTFLAGFHGPRTLDLTVKAGGVLSFEGVYPRELRAVVGQGRLPWRMEARGLRAWEAYTTAGETVNGRYIWPVKKLLSPATIKATE